MIGACLSGSSPFLAYERRTKKIADVLSKIRGKEVF